MSTVSLTDLTSRLRIYLKDTGSTRFKSDTDLQLFLNHAIVKWTSDLPIAETADLDAASDGIYTIPDDAVAVKWVGGYFYSSSYYEHLPPGIIEPGMYDTDEEPLVFILNYPTEGKFFTPRTTQGDTITLYYGKHHAWLDTDDSLDLGVRRWGEMAVLAYAGFLAHNPASAFRAGMEQWADKQDGNVDNPLEQEAYRWLEYYKSLMREHSRPMGYVFVEP